MPDGKSLIYGAYPGGEGFLFTIRLAGYKNTKRLEIASRGASSPAVARKGGRLAFVRNVFHSDVWRLELGGKPQPLLVSSAADSSAQFSPDGERIAFQSSRGGEGLSIWLANADGSGLVQLTRGPEDRHGSPSWSPDGRWVAFDARTNEGHWIIRVIESNGAQSRVLASGPFDNAVPSWSRDGKWIYFCSNRSGRFEIWRIPFQGGSAEQVTRDGGYVARESADGKLLYYTKTSSSGPLFARPLVGGDEKQTLEMVQFRGFTVVDDGIYYLHAGKTSEIRFHQLADGSSHMVNAIEAPRLGQYLSVSPKRKTFLFTVSASAGSDLMLIENFR